MPAGADVLRVLGEDTSVLSQHLLAPSIHWFVAPSLHLCLHETWASPHAVCFSLSLLRPLVPFTDSGVRIWTYILAGAGFHPLQGLKANYT